MSESTRTDLWCHACDRSFLALIDFRLDGNHQIECPRCGHVHYRVIKNGIATSDRFDSDQRATHAVPTRHAWRSASQPVASSTVSHFLRDLWLNRSDVA